MSFATVEKIANAVLYEGYMLYPYRSSAIKNQQRWNFGTLYPADYAQIQRPIEPSSMTTECLVIGHAATLHVRVRFLQLARRSASSDSNPSAWEEGFEKTADFSIPIGELIEQPGVFELLFKEQQSPDEQDARAFYLQRELRGTLRVCAEKLPSGACKLHFELENNTTFEGFRSCARAEALLQSFVSAHLLLAISGGEFVSLLEPPDEFREAAAGCRNLGAFPVLVDAPGAPTRTRTMMLSSPIILYDYPQVAPESAGDFFDGTEMDEMLALRVMTLTEDEKQQMRTGDSRARAILERTETLPQEHLLKMHGAIRGLKPIENQTQERAGDRSQ